MNYRFPCANIFVIFSYWRLTIGCSPNPCQRGAACFTGENPNGWGGYCQCPYPSGGFYCEIGKSTFEWKIYFVMYIKSKYYKISDNLEEYGFTLVLRKCFYFTTSWCLGSVVVSVMDSHSCNRGLIHGQNNHIYVML